MSIPEAEEELKILKFPDPRLRRIAEAVDEIDDGMRDRINEMLKLMREDHGIGLAAPQVGWNVRLFVMNLTGREDDDVVLINPEITSRKGKETAEEGCLSLPKVYAKVVRPAVISVKGRVLDGSEVEFEADGLLARCLQHEFDHLDGVLFIDKLTSARKRSVKGGLKRLQEEYAKAKEALKV